MKSREEGSVKTRAVYVALAIDIEGEKKVLVLWIALTEGAVSWLTIFGELKARGMGDCFIACVDGASTLFEEYGSLGGSGSTAWFYAGDGGVVLGGGV